MAQPKIIYPMPPLPCKLWIKDRVWKVEYSKTIKHYGDSNKHTRTIRIKAGMSPRETFKTLIHELLHALHMEHKFLLKHKTVYLLEDALFELIIDNFM